MVDTFPKLCGSLAGEASELGVRMHNAGYEARNLDYTYIAMESDDLNDAMKTIRGMNFCGLGVSMPFKESIISKLDEAGEDVETIGACNTVVFEDERAVGHNTDWRGAIRALKETSKLDVDKAVIIGAGGVARAISYGLYKEGIEVYISARSEEQRKELVNDLELSGHSSLEEQGSHKAELIVNATPVADLPESPVDFGEHGSGEWLLDVVFGEKNTDIINEAESRGWKTTHGWRMLLHQALEQFEFYTGEGAPKEPMAEVLENAL